MAPLVVITFICQPMQQYGLSRNKIELFHFLFEVLYLLALKTSKELIFKQIYINVLNVCIWFCEIMSFILTLSAETSIGTIDNLGALIITYARPQLFKNLKNQFKHTFFDICSNH